MLLSQIPNLLTLLRIAACPVLVLLLHDRNYELALVLFIAAGVTDGLDGFIAKRFDYESGLGAALDPIADKMLIGSTYIMLAILGNIPFWLLILVMFRDIVIMVGYLILAVMGNLIPMQPSYASKINTVVQISLMISILLEKSGMAFIHPVSNLLVFGVLITTLVSGGHYVWLWGIRHEYDDQSNP